MDTIHGYIAPTLGALRHLLAGLPDDINERDDADAVVEGLSDQSDAYAHELVQAYDYLLENHSHQIEHLYDEYVASPPLGPDGESTDEPFSPPSAPSLVEDEIRRVADLRRQLDRYMKYLVVFAHHYALEDFSQSELSRLTGATRVTISRWLADEDVKRNVASIARSKARQAVQDMKPSDIKDKATASAMGLLRWYASGGADQDHQSQSSTDDATGGDLHVVEVDRR